MDIAVAKTYARLWTLLSSAGITVGSHDLIIAATAISMDYTIITTNTRDFSKIEGLKFETL